MSPSILAAYMAKNYVKPPVYRAEFRSFMRLIRAETSVVMLHDQQTVIIDYPTYNQTDGRHLRIKQITESIGIIRHLRH